jgi:hypothetical protein
MGKPDAAVKPKAMFSVKGQQNNPDPRTKQELARQAAGSTGVLAMLRSGTLTTRRDISTSAQPWWRSEPCRALWP